MCKNISLWQLCKFAILSTYIHTNFLKKWLHPHSDILAFTVITVAPVSLLLAVSGYILIAVS